MSSAHGAIGEPVADSANPPAFRRAAIIGVGLLGGSLAAALKARGLASRVIGIGRDAAVRRCLDLALVDEAFAVASGDAAALAAVLDGADLVVLAAPVSVNAGLMPLLAGALPRRAILTDVSSVKAPVVAAARHDLGDRLAAFVPSHPIAGGERTGPEAARADLFDGRLVVMSPLAESDPAGVARLGALWQALGSRTEILDPAEHDRIYALVSHWPHALAFALAAAMAADRADTGRFAGPGLVEQTRIAASSPALWADILLTNRDASLAAARTVREHSDRIEAALQAGDREALIRSFDAAARWRRGFTTG